MKCQGFFCQLCFPTRRSCFSLCEDVRWRLTHTRCNDFPAYFKGKHKQWFCHLFSPAGNFYQSFMVLAEPTQAVPVPGSWESHSAEALPDHSELSGSCPGIKRVRWSSQSSHIKWWPRSSRRSERTSVAAKAGVTLQQWRQPVGSNDLQTNPLMTFPCFT